MGKYPEIIARATVNARAWRMVEPLLSSEPDMTFGPMGDGLVMALFGPIIP